MACDAIRTVELGRGANFADLADDAAVETGAVRAAVGDVAGVSGVKAGDTDADATGLVGAGAAGGDTIAGGDVARAGGALGAAGPATSAVAGGGVAGAGFADPGATAAGDLPGWYDRMYATISLTSVWASASLSFIASINCPFPSTIECCRSASVRRGLPLGIGEVGDRRHGLADDRPAAVNVVACDADRAIHLLGSQADPCRG